MELTDSRERIIAAAKQELQQVGILGLRVQEVARKADTSVALNGNPKLRERIEQTTQRLFNLTLKVIANSDTSEKPNPSNHRVIALMISSINLIFINNDLLGDSKITDKEYLSFLNAYFKSLNKK